MKNKLIVLAGSVIGFPLMALAAAPTCSAYRESGTIQYIICQIGDILAIIIPILIVLGVLYFVWGVVSYVIGSDEEAKKKGRDRMIYGIIGLVVIVAIWGIVAIVRNTFKIGTDNPIAPPIVNY